MRAQANARSDHVAVTLSGSQLTFGELEVRATNLAHHLLSLGVEPADYVTIAEPNSFEWFTAFLACWKLGATPQPVSSRLPPLELAAIVDLADSPVVIGMEHATRPWLPRGFIAPPAPAGWSPPAVPPSPAWKAPTSGGSTGRPKLIVSGDPAIWTSSLVGLARVIGARADGTTVMPGPLYHNGPLIWSWLTLLSGGNVALLPRFDAESTLAAIQENTAESIYLVPTMMQRMWKLPNDTKYAYDLSSLRVAFHLAEPCPKWLKEAWIDWIGADVLFELYGGTEAQCFTVLDGNEWLAHPGSVGKPLMGELKIMDEDGNDLPNGETGSVWMRNTARETPSYIYIGDEAEEQDGWECLGDMGWMDDDGYLYLADRRKDMILVGGANVFPAEIEAAIGAHPKVRSSAVIGLPDKDKGNRIHAIVDAVDLDSPELTEFLAERLVTYKIPRTYEFVKEPLRDDAGKVRRTALVAERSA
ncbi:MAG: acid--CoA ligase [Acidimicrobiales bacterium]|nr:MAG: acid--CoA ligase [Acidimicrobiales bacterium]